MSSLLITTKRDRRLTAGAGVIIGGDVNWLSLAATTMHQPMPYDAGGARGGTLTST
jgi:hypothetical protein